MFKIYIASYVHNKLVPFVIPPDAQYWWIAIIYAVYPIA